MKLEFDRESEDYAREVIEMLYSHPETRRMLMELLADSINYAHQQGPALWEVTLNASGWARLNVGKFFVCTFARETVSLHLDEATLNDKLRAEMKLMMPDWNFKKLQGTLFPEIPIQKLADLLPLIKDSYYRWIERAAQSVQGQSPYAKSHHWGLIKYLRSYLETNLPDPAYPRLAEIAFGNEAAFRKSLRDFVDYASSDRYGPDERDYKKSLIDRMGQALSDEALNSSDFLANLRIARKECSAKIDNLTHWTNTADFMEYLQVIPQERIRNLLRDLFNEETDLVSRIDWFKSEVNLDYSKYLQRKGRRIQLNMIAVLLTARYPESYIFYQRKSVIRNVCDLWGIEQLQGNTDGERYIAYMDFLQPIQARLSQALDRAADSIDVHSFLWLNGTDSAKNVWRVAPGQQAKFWNMCRERDCIVIHWLDDVDFSRFSDKNAIKQALIQAGQSGGGAPYIWSFTNEIKPGNIVVANRGEKTVVGIGVIKSEYIAPLHATNPSTDAHYRHARSVEWRITKPVEIPFKFLQPTVESLPPEKWEQIKRTYLTSYPNDEELKTALDSLEIVEELKSDELREPEMIRQLIETCSRTRNVILYGPPGSGKTYWVRKFAKHFLQTQLEAPPGDEPQILRWLEDLTWYEAIALAMLMEGKERYKVNELLSSHIIHDFASLRNAAKLANTIWAQLQIHTSPNSETVNYANRSEPFLFDKTQSAEWYLTAEGKEYIESNLGLALAQLKRPALTGLSIEDFSEFVTFHQSFAYEEFVEGLRPRTDEAGQVRYEIIDGVFKRICRRAELDQKNKYLIVIDEINRANIAKVLGELITLLEDDKRMGEENAMTAALPYSGQRFSIPKNLYVIGTMNTADRSIALLDLALRRRFSFVEMMPDSSLLGFVEGVNLNVLLARLNERITALLDRDHQIGHSYFMGARDTNDLRFAWYHRVVPLVQEYFYNDGERLRSVLGDEFMADATANSRTRAALRDLYDPEIVKYEIVVLDDERFLEALRNLAAE